MKFRQINEENFLEKIVRYLEGLGFARNCKLDQPKSYDELIKKFTTYGYRLLFKESLENWLQTDSDNYVFIDNDLSKLVIVQYYNGGKNRLVAVYNKGNFNLLKPSYLVNWDLDPKNYIPFFETVDNICNGNENLLDKKEPKGKDYTALFRIMEEVTKKFGNIKIDKKYSIDQLNTITGGLSKKYVSNGDLLFAIKAGCSLGQLLLYVRMLYTGQLDTGECLDIATSYYA